MEGGTIHNHVKGTKVLPRLLKIRRLHVDLHAVTVGQIRDFIEKGVKGVAHGDVTIKVFPVNFFVTETLKSPVNAYMHNVITNLFGCLFF